MLCPVYNSIFLGQGYLSSTCVKNVFRLRFYRVWTVHMSFWQVVTHFCWRFDLILQEIYFIPQYDLAYGTFLTFSTCTSLKEMWDVIGKHFKQFLVYGTSHTFLWHEKKDLVQLHHPVFFHKDYLDSICDTWTFYNHTIKSLTKKITTLMTYANNFSLDADNNQFERYFSLIFKGKTLYLYEVKL